MITAVDVSPDGKYARVTRMTKPFSYIVPVEQLRIDRRSVGRKRQGAGEAQRARAEPRRAGSESRSAAGPSSGAQPAGGGGRGGAGAANNGKRDLMWRADGQGFNYLQLEPLPAASTGRNGRAGRNAGGDQAQTGVNRRRLVLRTPRRVERREVAARTRSSRRARIA